MSIPNFEKFNAQVGKQFLITGAGALVNQGSQQPPQVLALTLDSARLGRRYRIDNFECENFSLLFSGSAEQPLTQGVYSFESSDLGDVSLFTVPVSQSENAIEYEVVVDHRIAD